MEGLSCAQVGAIPSSRQKVRQAGQIFCSSQEPLHLYYTSSFRKVNHLTTKSEHALRRSEETKNNLRKTRRFPLDGRRPRQARHPSLFSSYGDFLLSKVLAWEARIPSILLQPEAVNFCCHASLILLYVKFPKSQSFDDKNSSTPYGV